MSNFIFHKYNEECCFHNCMDCKHEDYDPDFEPCKNCVNNFRSNDTNDKCFWEPKIDKLNNQIFEIVDEPQFALQQLKRNDLEEKDRIFNEKIVENCIIDMLKLLSSEQRLKIFFHFCVGCGDIQPEGNYCQCRNDE